MAQSFTFCASVNPIMYLGAKPVLVDSESGSWNMDPALLDRAIELAPLRVDLIDARASLRRAAASEC